MVLMNCPHAYAVTSLSAEASFYFYIVVLILSMRLLRNQHTL